MVTSDSNDSDVLPSSKLPSHHDVTAESDGEELPDVLSSLQSRFTARNSSPKKSSQFKENLEQLNKRRRLSDKKAKSREKHAKRVVVSPSPEPVQVVASHPSLPSSSVTASGKIRKRINVRETSSKGKHPPKRILFRAPSDDSDTNQASEATEATEDDEPVSGNRSKRRRDKGKRLQVREPTPTSSSSSSSSSGSDPNLVSDDDEELEPEVENIKLDFDPVLKDKLRPKDDSKARRLDKLREARAAKESKSAVTRR